MQFQLFRKNFIRVAMSSYTEPINAPDVSEYLPTQYGLPAGSIVQALHQGYLDTDVLVAALTKAYGEKGKRWDIDVRIMNMSRLAKAHNYQSKLEFYVVMLPKALSGVRLAKNYLKFVG
jgi:hypothetical protein